MKNLFLALLVLFVLNSCKKSEIEKEKPLLGNLQEAPIVKNTNEILNAPPTYYCNCKTQNRINAFDNPSSQDEGVLLWKGTSNRIYFGDMFNINEVITDKNAYCLSYDGITGVIAEGVRNIAYMGLSNEIFYGKQLPTGKWSLKRIGTNFTTRRQPAIGYIGNTIYIFWADGANKLWYSTPALADQNIAYPVSNFDSMWGLYACSYGYYMVLLFKGTDGNYYLSTMYQNSNGTLDFSNGREMIKSFDPYDVSFNMFKENGVLTINSLSWDKFANPQYVNQTCKKMNIYNDWVISRKWDLTNPPTLNAPVGSVIMTYSSDTYTYKYCFVRH